MTPWLPASTVRAPCPTRLARYAGSTTSCAGKAQSPSACARAGTRKGRSSLRPSRRGPRAVFQGEHVVGIRQQVPDRARQLIEALVIATNAFAARFLASRGNASLRRDRDRPLGERHMGSHLHAPS